jgi:oxygen-independent coproporphyrinogen-3 oxidase
MERYKHKTAGKTFDTVYIGGGTPSVLPPFLLQKLFDGIHKNFSISGDAEITVEINPKTADKQKMALLKTLGANRASVGLQSVNDETLALLRRGHTSADFVDTVEMLHAAGIANVSGDIILGLPNQTANEVKQAANLFGALGLNHASAYALTVEKGTPLAKAVKAGQVILPDDDAAADLYDVMTAALNANGFKRYEVSNFAKKGFLSKHNTNCWLGCDYLGLGVNSHSLLDGRRFSNVQSIENYIERIIGKRSPVSKTEKLSPTELMWERVMLGLRLEKGFSVEKLNADFNADLFSFNENFREKIRNGQLLFDGKFLSVNPCCFYVLNDVLSDLIF